VWQHADAKLFVAVMDEDRFLRAGEQSSGTTVGPVMEEFPKLVRAVEEGNEEEEVIRLLDGEPGLLERGKYGGDRPLAWAAFSGQLGVVTLLIEMGANINATGYGGKTALHHAAAKGTEGIVALLLDKGAHANTRDQGGRAPIMLACENGNLGVVKMLVQHSGGQGLNERSEAGWTALHYASFAGHHEVVRFLLLAGADPSITDDMGRTPRAIVEGRHYSQSVRAGRGRCVAVFQVRPLTC
jgi:ankyrin repeat protein